MAHSCILFSLYVLTNRVVSNNFVFYLVFLNFNIFSAWGYIRPMIELIVPQPKCRLMTPQNVKQIDCSPWIVPEFPPIVQNTTQHCPSGCKRYNICL